MKARTLKLGAAGAATGLINGLLGIGGGSFLVPVLVLMLGMDEHEAHGTSLATILPTSCISAAIYASRSLVDFPTAGWAATGGAVGAYIGAKLMRRMSPSFLRRLFAIFLAVAAVRMIFAGAVR